MPELPEVEITCRGICPSIEGRILTKVTVRENRLRWPVPSDVMKLKEVKVDSVSRRAKYILIRILKGKNTSNKNARKGTLILHLGMSGRLTVLTNEKRPDKHDHVDFIFDNGMVLRYTDPRRFGSILWTTEDPNLHPLLAKLGPEPLSSDFSAQYLHQKSMHHKVMIKKLIMDQAIVVGVGNIYANEALFKAKISPLRIANTLSLAECKALVRAVKAVLEKAIEQGGTTLRDFLRPDGKLGYFVQKLSVYGREGESCPSCGEVLLAEKIGQRATVYCSNCQV